MNFVRRGFVGAVAAGRRVVGNSVAAVVRRVAGVVREVPARAGGLVLVGERALQPALMEQRRIRVGQSGRHRERVRNAEALLPMEQLAERG